MYKCNECEERFDVPRYDIDNVITDIGIPQLVMIKKCPYCGSYDIRLEVEDEQCIPDRENDE